MSRPQKEGLDYFPFDVALQKDKKLRRPKMKYGYLATEVYIALLTLLYSEKGYYIPYKTSSQKEDCIWYVMDILQGKYQPDANTIAEIIEELVACELFSGDRYPENITSKRSQAVYYSATVERKTVVIDDTIWMLSLSEMKDLSEKHFYYLSKVSQSKNEDNRPNNGVNRPNNPQRKVKESKEKKSKEKDGGQKLLTEDEYTSLCATIGQASADYYLERVAAFLEKKPTATFNVKATILKWNKEDKAKELSKEQSKSVKTYTTEALNAKFDSLNYEDL